MPVVGCYCTSSASRFLRARLLFMVIGMAMTIVLASTLGTVAAGADPSIRVFADPFLQQHCVECHAGDRPEGGLNLATCSDDLTDAEIRSRWVELYDRVASGEMPPKNVPVVPEPAKKSRITASGFPATKKRMESSTA